MKICIYIPITKVDFLDETFTSVVNQKSQEFDILAMDNSVNSSDYVKNKFEEYFGKRTNARLIKTPHHLGDGDPTQSWNYGANHIVSEYFTLLGDDDMLSPNYIEEMLELMSAYKDAPIYRCRVNIINENSEITKYGQMLPALMSWDEYIYNRKIYGFIQSTSEFCIRMSLFTKIGGYYSYPYAICSDDATYLALMLYGEMVSTNNTYAYWRRHGNNLSMRVSYKTRVVALEKYYNYVQKLISENSHTLDNGLILKTVQVNRKKERLMVMKNHLYKSFLFRPMVNYLYKHNIINTI